MPNHSMIGSTQYTSAREGIWNQSMAMLVGTTERSASPPWLSTGLTRASTTNIRVKAIAISRGGLMWARGTRCTCTQASTPAISGAPMWMNASSVNSRLLTFSW
jgi:hypothetical protein